MSVDSFFSFCDSHQYVFGLALAASSTVALYSTYKLWQGSSGEITSEETQNDFWDKEEFFIRWVNYHFGRKDQLSLQSYDFGYLAEGVYGSKTLADEAIAAYKGVKESVPNRALDVGCAVGGVSFELAREFKTVVGLDFSRAAVNIANRLKETGTSEYPVVIESEIEEIKTARVDPAIDRSRVEFIQGDACDFPSDIGQFGCVVASNILAQVPNPYKFLGQLPNIVAPGGVVLLADNYSWFEMFSPKELWLGGFRDTDGKPVKAFDTLKKEMDKLGFELIKVKEFPYFLRDSNNRSFDTGSDHGTIWKKK